MIVNRVSALFRAFPIKNTSVQLLLVIAFVWALGPTLPLPFKAGAYTFSVLVKDTLLIFLPLIIFSCLFHTLESNAKLAFRFVTSLFAMVIVSNLISILFGYAGGVLTLSHFDFSGFTAVKQDQSVALAIQPIFQVGAYLTRLSVWYNNQNALMLGLGLGLLSTVYRPPSAFRRTTEMLYRLAMGFLKRVFIPILPLFVFGFLLKMQHEGQFESVLGTYVPIIGLVAVLNAFYLGLIYACATAFNWQRFIALLKAMLPAGLAGFTTMSSIAALPVSLEATQNAVSLENRPVVKAVVPATVNIHLIGDSIAIMVLSLAVLLAFGRDMPSTAEFMAFLQYFMVAKFSVATVPGGSILTLLPALQHAFGFSTEMLGFITAIYILFDPIITASNVMGNGAFAVLFARLPLAQRLRVA